MDPPSLHSRICTPYVLHASEAKHVGPLGPSPQITVASLVMLLCYLTPSPHGAKHGQTQKHPAQRECHYPIANHVADA